jgi:hypothetical protein
MDFNSIDRGFKVGPKLITGKNKLYPVDFMYVILHCTEEMPKKLTRRLTITIDLSGEGF